LKSHKGTEQKNVSQSELKFYRQQSCGPNSNKNCYADERHDTSSSYTKNMQQQQLIDRRNKQQQQQQQHQRQQQQQQHSVDRIAKFFLFFPYEALWFLLLLLPEQPAKLKMRNCCRRCNFHG